MKTIDKLTTPELKGLAVSILREEFGFTWVRIACIMGMKSDVTPRVYYKKFQNIYALHDEKVDNGSLSAR